MCSWCYAFAPTWQKILDNLDSSVHVKYVHGGLAPHSDRLMPQTMQNMLQNTWRNIEQKVGTKFNYDFWSTCKPRRSTYLACQACISARVQGKEYEMIKETQKAYYLNASNPSDRDTLERVASNINLDVEKFSLDLESEEIITIFEKDLNKRRKLGANGFPSLVLKINNKYFKIEVNYANHESVLKQIHSYM
jgi:putative protein-disulfide isomerase